MSDYLPHFREVAHRLGGYWYLATPYSKYEDGIEAAATEAGRVAAFLLDHGVPVFCPVAHSHWIARIGNLDPHDHELWMASDLAFVCGACGLIVAKLPGWETSLGIQIEVQEFTRANKLVHHWVPPC